MKPYDGVWVSPNETDVKFFMHHIYNNGGSYTKDIEEIRTLRDKVFAHNDKTEFQFWKCPEKPDLEFEGEVWGRIEELLRWVQESTLSLRTALGDGYPIGHEIENDLDKLMDSMVEKRN